MKKLFGALLCAVLAAAFLLRSNAVALNMFAGLCICLDILLPSLFPFMALAGFITLAGYGKIISFPFRPITTLAAAPAG